MTEKQKQENRPRSLCVGVLMERNIDYRAFWGMMWVAQSYAPEWLQLAYGRRDIMANNYCKRFLEETNKTHFLLLKADHVYTHELIDQCDAAVEKDYGAGVIIPGDYSCFLIRRECLQAVKPPWFFKTYNKEDGRLTDKDLFDNFLETCAAAGQQVITSDIIKPNPHIQVAEATWRPCIRTSRLRQDRDVLIGIPVERSIDQFAFYNFIELARQGYALISVPYVETDEARTWMGIGLLQSPYQWLLMLDSDHRHPSHIVTALLAAAAGGGYDEKDWGANRRQVVAGLNFRRSEPYDPCAGNWTDETRKHWVIQRQWDPIVIPCDMIGSGCIMIHRTVFESIETPWFGYEYDRGEGAEMDFPGTDITFSKRCQDLGIRQWLEPRLSSPHLTSVAVDNRFFEAHLNKSLITGTLERVEESEPEGILTEEPPPTVQELMRFELDGDNGGEPESESERKSLLIED